MRASNVDAGALFINASQERLRQFEDIKFQGLQGASARKIVLVVGIMAAHALGEGSGVGVSFCGTRGWAQARNSPVEVLLVSGIVAKSNLGINY